MQLLSTAVVGYSSSSTIMSSRRCRARPHETQHTTSLLFPFLLLLKLHCIPPSRRFGTTSALCSIDQVKKHAVLGCATALFGAVRSRPGTRQSGLRRDMQPSSVVQSAVHSRSSRSAMSFRRAVSSSNSQQAIATQMEAASVRRTT